jgi:hypothetical protein
VRAMDERCHHPLTGADPKRTKFSERMRAVSTAMSRIRGVNVLQPRYSAQTFEFEPSTRPPSLSSFWS